MQGENIRLSELQKAKDAGFQVEFVFTAGRIRQLFRPDQTYAFCQVVTGIFSCPIDKCEVYRIQTPAGIKGFLTIKNNKQ